MHITMKYLIYKPSPYKVENRLTYAKSSAVYFSSAIIIIPLLVVMSLVATMHLNVQAQVASNNDSNNSTGQYVLRRGIISSELGQPEQLNVHRTIILQHRQDGKDYTGTLTFTASKPVEVLFGHRLNIDNKTLSNIDMKKFGDLFLVNPIHPNAGYVISAPSVIKPDYRASAPPYFSASLPFVASSVVLRTLGGIPFIAIYEVSAHIGQPQITNNVTTAQNSNSTNNNAK